MKYVMLFPGVPAGIPLIWRQREPLGLKNPWQALLLCLGFSAGSMLSAMLFAPLEGLLSGNRFGFGAISTYGVYFLFPPAVWFAAKGMKRDGFPLLAGAYGAFRFIEEWFPGLFWGFFDPYGSYMVPAGNHHRLWPLF